MQVLEERGAASAQGVDDLLLALVEWDGVLRRGGPEGGQFFGEIERDSAVAFAKWFEADPDDLACGDESVEIGWAIAEDACGEDLGFEDGCREWRSLKVFDDVEKSVESATRLHDALPARDEAGEGGLLYGLHFLAQASEALAADGAEHLGIAPLAMNTSGAETSFDDTAGVHESAKDDLDCIR
jgi:hypothetical protein